MLPLEPHLAFVPFAPRIGCKISLAIQQKNCAYGRPHVYTQPRLRRERSLTATAVDSDKHTFSSSCEPMPKAEGKGARECREIIESAVAKGADVLIVGRGRRGRVASVVAGSRSLQARRTLVVAPTRSAVEMAVKDARQAWPEAEVFQVLKGGMDERKNVARSALKPQFSIVVGTALGVGDAFLAEGRNASWMRGVDVLLLYDIRLLHEIHEHKIVRVLTRLATQSGGTQVVIVADSLNGLPSNAVGLDFLRRDRQVDVTWDSSCNEGEDIITDVRSIPQRYASVRPSLFLPALIDILRDCVQRRTPSEPYKAVFFFQTARMAQYYAELLRFLGTDIYEVHSGKTKTHNEDSLLMFDTLLQGVLFSSEHVSRGANFAAVNRVIHVGLPLGPEVYEARLRELLPGGTSLALLLGYEVPTFFSRKIMASSVSEGLARAGRVRNLGEGIGASPRDLQVLKRAQAKMSSNILETTYASWLRTHQLAMEEIGWSQEQMVLRGWQWARDIAGLDRPPVLPVRIVEELGLLGVPGILTHYGEDPEEARKRTVVREPDMHGKFKKRKPMGRWHYSPRRHQ